MTARTAARFVTAGRIAGIITAGGFSGLVAGLVTAGGFSGLIAGLVTAGGFSGLVAGLIASGCFSIAACVVSVSRIIFGTVILIPARIRFITGSNTL